MQKAYNQNNLPLGTMVQEYKVVKILGTGNFGIVYAAENKYFSDMVALKEFLPSDLACRSAGETNIRPVSSESEKAFEWARKKFLQEAKTLRELGSPSQHPNIVRVIQFIEANDTAYMVMDFEKGLPLSQILEERGSLDETMIRSILDALLDGLERVHAASVWHRDIKPSNILIRSDGSPVLIDFGAARKDISGSDRSTMAVFSPAFAAPEQILPMGDQGPWTDIYALGATLYRAVTGDLAVNAANRLQKDTYRPSGSVAQRQYSKALLAAIDAALRLSPNQRPQSISQWKALLHDAQGAEDDRTRLYRLPKSAQKGKPVWPWRYVPFSILPLILFAGLAYLLYRPSQPPAPPPTVITDPPKLGVNTGNERSVEDSGAARVRATANIISIPEAAQVYINDEFRGNTPLDLSLAQGTHSLRLTLDAHHDWDSKLVVEEKGNIPIRIPLLKK